MVHNEIEVVTLKLTLVYLSVCQLLSSETGPSSEPVGADLVQSHYYTFYTSMKAQTKNIQPEFTPDEISSDQHAVTLSEVMVCSVCSHNSVVCVNKRGGKGG